MLKRSRQSSNSKCFRDGIKDPESSSSSDEEDLKTKDSESVFQVRSECSSSPQSSSASLLSASDLIDESHRNRKKSKIALSSQSIMASESSISDFPTSNGVVFLALYTEEPKTNEPIKQTIRSLNTRVIGVFGSEDTAADACRDFMRSELAMDEELAEMVKDKEFRNKGWGFDKDFTGFGSLPWTELHGRIFIESRKVY